jgi:hypothetical protein
VALNTIPKASNASANCSSEISGGKFATKTLPRKFCDLIGSPVLARLSRRDLRAQSEAARSISGM